MAAMAAAVGMAAAMTREASSWYWASGTVGDSVIARRAMVAISSMSVFRRARRLGA